MGENVYNAIIFFKCLFSLTSLSHSPLFQCFSGLYWGLALLPPPAFSSGGNVPGSAVLFPKIDTPWLGEGDSTDASVWVLPSGAFSVTLSSVTTQSVVPGVSEGPVEIMDGEVMMGGIEVGVELVLVWGFAQRRLHHWACTVDEKRKKRARVWRRAPILWLCLAWMYKQANAVNCSYVKLHTSSGGPVVVQWYKKYSRDGLSASYCPLCSFSFLFFSSLVMSSLSPFVSVSCSVCNSLTSLSFFPLPPLLSPCVITDSPSSGTLQHSRLFLSLFLRCRLEC